MKMLEIESVGEKFKESLIVSARDKTLRVIEAVSKQVVPGMSEERVRELVNSELEKSGSEKFWHAPQIRLGINTLRAFGEPGELGVKLFESDVYFLDLGPVYLGHEGDVGRTFAVGKDPEMIRIARDVETIWKLVRDHWSQTQESGAKLYAFASQQAQELGWVLSLHEANGHRIADFPHVAKQRGTIEGLDFKPAPSKWILEIHIKHPTRPFGAFYEDLLN